MSYLVSGLGGELLGSRLGFSLPAPVLDASLLGRVAALFPLGVLAALPPAVGAARGSAAANL